MLGIKWISRIFLILFAALSMPGIAKASTENLPKMSIYYYYYNPCGSCNEEGKFYDKFNTLVGEEKEGISLQFSCFNVFHASDQKEFLRACDKYGIPEGKQTTPLVILNGKPLIGEETIYGKLQSTFIEEKKKILQLTAANDKSVSRFAYFYVNPCEECTEVKQFFDGLPSVFTVTANGQQFESTTIIDSYNIAEPKNLELVTKYFWYYGVPESKQEVPIVFLRDGYLSGKEEIRNNLEAAIKNGRGIGMSQPGGEALLQPYEWAGIFLTGLINGFNPCSISMLLFLVTILLARKANVLKLGSLFILGKLIAYLALGTLLFNVLSFIDNRILHLFTGIVKYVLLIVTLFVAGFNINDYIAARSEKYHKIRLQLPLKLRKLNHKWMKGIGQTNGALIFVTVLALGMLISVGEFLCTGQIYLATILYFLRYNPDLNLQMLLMFLVYILGMLLPLAIITLVIHKGREVFNISELARKNMPAIKLINAGVFIVFGIIIIILF